LAGGEVRQIGTHRTHSRLRDVLDAAFATLLILAAVAIGSAGIYVLSRLVRGDGSDLWRATDARTSPGRTAEG
jgi:hypothetical protein